MREPIAYHINQAAELVGLGRTTLYAAIRKGQLRAIKVGRRTLVRSDDLVRYMDALPSLASQNDPSPACLSTPSKERT